MDREELRKLIDKYSEAYHNGESLISDEAFSLLLDQYGNYDKIGADPLYNKIDLPYFLGSLDKIKTEEEINKWKNKYKKPYLIEDKIDGLTLLYKSGELYTRGNGTKGMDVSHLLPYLNLEKIDFFCRGEIVITKKDFEKYKNEYSNARNLVSGLINSKKVFKKEILKLLKFYAYRIMDSNDTPLNQLKELKNKGFLIPSYIEEENLNLDDLTSYLIERKEKAEYEMDGIVIYQNKKNIDYSKNVIAFKINSEIAITKVTDIVWEASKNLLLKPVVYFEPVKLSGAILTKASGYNAKFIINNKIGLNSIISITRTGDVIPKIVDIIKESDEMILPKEKYHWNDNKVEFILDNSNDEVEVNRINHFIKVMNIKGIGPKRAKLYVDNGILLEDLINADKEINIKGIGDEISNIQFKVKAPLAKWMAASNIFQNIGERRFELILSIYPNLLELDNISDKIRKIKGFKNLSDYIADHIEEFKDWIKKLNVDFDYTDNEIIIENENENIDDNNNDLTNQVIVFSGFRNKELEDIIIKRNGIIRNTVTKKTTILIVFILFHNRDSKFRKAKELGIKILSLEEFLEKYNIKL